MVVLLTAGQAGDSPMFGPLMAHLRIARDRGRPRTRPDAVRADKAYSSRAIRGHLRSRGVTAVIPEPSDQQGHRKRRGSRGGRPPGFDAEFYKGRNVIERRFCHVKQWRGIATRYDKLAVSFRAPSSSMPSSSGPGICQTCPNRASTKPGAIQPHRATIQGCGIGWAGLAFPTYVGGPGCLPSVRVLAWPCMPAPW